MSLTPRGSSRPSRRQRTDKAYRLVVATGTAAVATIVTFVLALVGVASFGFFILLLLITAGLAYATRSSVR